MNKDYSVTFKPSEELDGAHGAPRCRGGVLDVL